MIQVRGFYLPDDEEHLGSFLERGPEFAGGPTYQLHKLIAALPWVKNFRTAIDIGGHCGLWSRPLARMFRTVEAFEPVERHRACFAKNLAEVGNVTLHVHALGEHNGTVNLHSGPNSSGDTTIDEAGEHEAIMATLDSFHLANVDFIKVDVEGYELFALRGGEETIRRNRPCIIVEQKPGKAQKFGLGETDAVAMLESWGAKLRTEISGDFILSWP